MPFFRSILHSTTLSVCFFVQGKTSYWRVIINIMSEYRFFLCTASINSTDNDNQVQLKHSGTAQMDTIILTSIYFINAPLAQKGHLNCFAKVCLFFVWTGAFFARFPIFD